MMYWDGNMGAWGFVLIVVSFMLFWGAVIAAIVLLPAPCPRVTAGAEAPVPVKARRRTCLPNASPAAT